MAEKKGVKRPQGRPPHAPNNRTRALVERMLSENASLETIAMALGITQKTLQKHYDIDARAHQRTSETETRVRTLMLAGMTQSQIAMSLRINERTLRSRYADIVEEMMPRLIGGIGGTLMQQAQRGNVAACIFILKTRGGPEWHPPKEHRISGDPNNDTPVPVQVVRRVIVDPAAQDGDDD